MSSLSEENKKLLTQDSDVLSETLKDPKLSLLLNHPISLRILSHYAKGSFDAPDLKYGFWANNLQPAIENNAVVFKDGKQVYRHHGHENLSNLHNEHKDYQENNIGDKDDNRGSITLYNAFESLTGFKDSKDKIPNLSEVETDPNLSSVEKQFICALQSMVYARSAHDTVITSVQGAGINSFFRTAEIDTIMNNPNITKIQILSENMTEAQKSHNGIGTVTLSSEIDKKKAYHMLRDEWVESAAEKYKQAEQGLIKAYETQNVQESHKIKATAIFLSARENLSNECAIAEQKKEQTHPFSRNGFYNKDTSPQYDNDDKIQETKRITLATSSLKSTPQHILDLIPKEELKNSDSKIQAFKTALSVTTMSDMDKALYTSIHTVSAISDHPLYAAHARNPESIGKIITQTLETQDALTKSGKPIEQIMEEAISKVGSENLSVARRRSSALLTNPTAKPSSSPQNMENLVQRMQYRLTEGNTESKNPSLYSHTTVRRANQKKGQEL